MIQTHGVDGIHLTHHAGIDWRIVQDGDRYNAMDAGLPSTGHRLIDALPDPGLSPERTEALVVSHFLVDNQEMAARMPRGSGTPWWIQPQNAHISELAGPRPRCLKWSTRTGPGHLGPDSCPAAAFRLHQQGLEIRVHGGILLAISIVLYLLTRLGSGSRTRTNQHKKPTEQRIGDPALDAGSRPADDVEPH